MLANSNKGLMVKIGVVTAIGLAAVILLGLYFQHEALYPRSDDATLQANMIQVAALVSGQVATVNVQNDQAVNKGDLLFALNAQPFKHNAQIAQAEINSLPKANDPARAAYEAAYDAAQYAIANSNYYSALSGVVANLTNLKVGQQIVVGDPLFIIVDTHSYWVDANFSARQASRIKVGQAVRINVPLYPELKLTGTVVEISSDNPADGKIAVKIKVDSVPNNRVLQVGVSCSVLVNTTTGILA